MDGDPELLAWFNFGFDPINNDGEILGDGEIVELILRRRETSSVLVHWEHVPERASADCQRDIMVLFELEGVYDLQLDGFSQQNVTGGIRLARAPARPDRRPYYALDPLPGDVELQLGPCYGLDGYIRAQRAKVRIDPGATPLDADTKWAV